MQAATRLKSVYDTINANTKIEIVQRPNPDGSPMVWGVQNRTLEITGGDYAGTFITSRWQDSTYTLVRPAGSTGALVNMNIVSNLTFSNLSVENTSGMTLGGFRLDECVLSINGVTLDGFRNSINAFDSKLKLDVDITGDSNKAIWNQGGKIIFSGCNIYNNTIGISNRGIFTGRGNDVYNNGINVMQEAGSLFNATDLFGLDTDTTNMHVEVSRGGIFAGGQPNNVSLRRKYPI